VREGKASASAMTVALARAHLHRLGAIDDPHAGTVLTPRHEVAGLAFRRGPLAGYGRSPTFGYIACRTRFFDDAVTRALDDGVTQVVILGAGYDSRPLRLARPGVRWFEVDHPATQTETRRRLPAPDVTYVPLDLVAGDLPAALRRAGFERSRPAAFLAEGLTMYLERSTAGSLLADIAGAAAPDSRLAADFSQGGGSVSLPSRVVASAMRRSFEVRGEQRFDWADEATTLELLRGAGWAVSEVARGPELAERYLRGTPLRTEGVSPWAFCLQATKA
jgi:methyltransferase (TIGR00027 family)